MPKNIPAAPIYISLLGFWSNMGQDEIYDRWLREPLEKYGAVKLWFSGQWSILTTRPDLLTEIFRNEDVYIKAGSQIKNPGGIISELVGDNIINTHGDNWRLYTSIMKPGLQKRVFDTRPILEKSRTYVTLLLREQEASRSSTGINPSSLNQRWAISVMGQSFLDIDFGCLEKPGVRIEVLQGIIKKALFRPLFFNFPVLDKLRWLLPWRKAAFAAVYEFENLLVELIASRPRRTRRPEDEQVVHMLERARDEGRLTDAQYRANLKIVFLTAHENVQQLMTSMYYALGRNQAVQERLRAEVLATGVADPSIELLNSMPYLTGTVLELLRLYPPVSQLLNRVTLAPTRLGGEITVPGHTWVGWNAPGVQRNPNIWGPQASELIPERWGRTAEEVHSKFRREQVKGNYIPFNAHTRKCLGSGFALLQTKILLFELVRRVRWHIDPNYKLKLTSVSSPPPPPPHPPFIFSDAGCYVWAYSYSLLSPVFVYFYHYSQRKEDGC
jgi:unspecific monooxygenase